LAAHGREELAPAIVDPSCILAPFVTAYLSATVLNVYVLGSAVGVGCGHKAAVANAYLA
jgi:hypothetical protein